MSPRPKCHVCFLVVACIRTNAAPSSLALALVLRSKVATLLKGAVALVGRGAKSFEVTGLMSLGMDDLFTNPGYWLEATLLVVFFVIVNMFPCIRDTNVDQFAYHTPLQAITDSLGREGTNLESCVRRDCRGCELQEGKCLCLSWNKQLVPVSRLHRKSQSRGDIDEAEEREPKQRSTLKKIEALPSRPPALNRTSSTLIAEPSVSNQERQRGQACPDKVSVRSYCRSFPQPRTTSKRSRSRSSSSKKNCKSVKIICACKLKSR